MSNTYIKIKCAATNVHKTPDGIGKKLAKVDFTEEVPQANPDFHNMIGEVAFWLIEFENDSYFPNREIGLDAREQPLMIMPWRKNYGYWTDNNLVIKDFRSNFETANISKEEFEQQWKLFEAGH